MKKIFIITIIFLAYYFSYSQMTIVTQPQSINACVGSNDTIRIIVANNADNITYNIMFDPTYSGTFSSIFNTTTNNTSYEYVILNIQSSSSGRYCIEVDDGTTTLVSNSFIINVSTAVPTINSITLSPNDTVLCHQAQKDIILNVTPAAEPMQYIWYKNSVFYSSTSNNILTFAHASSSDEGSYYVAVSNGCGVATNIFNPINLNYLEKPNLVSNPNIPMACEGDTISVTVYVTGDNINYSWIERNAGVDNLIVGAITNTLEIQNVPYPLTNTYLVIANNICYQDTLIEFGFPSGNLPEIQAQPSNPPICIGDTLFLNSFASSSSTVTYQWYGDNLLLPSSNTTQYVVNTANGYNNTYFYIAYNSCGSDTSDVFTAQFLSAPVFTAQPNDTTVCVGTNVLLTTKVTGDEPMTLAWNYLHNNNGILVQDANAITQSAGTQLAISNIQESQSRPYYCIATNACGTAYSDTAIIIVNIPISLQMDLSDQTICEGDSLGFSLAYINQVFGTTPITYTWYKEAVPNDVILGNNNIYSISSANLSDSGVYYCELANICNTIQTYHAAATIKSLPYFTVQPQATSVCQGQTVNLSAHAEGEAPISYLWYRNNSAISNQTTENLSVANSIVNHTGYYYCLAQNSCSPAGIASDSVFVSVGTPVAFQNPLYHTPITGPNGSSFCENETLQLKILVNGINLNVTWYHNGNVIPSINDTILIINNATTLYSGQYYCVISNQCNSITSDTISINITPAPNINLGADMDFCEGESDILQTTGSFTNYTWTKDGDEINTHAPTIEVFQTGTYTLQVTDMNTGCTDIDTIIVTAHPYYNIPLSETITECSDYYLLDAGAGGYEYTWSTGTTYQTITVQSSGEYSLTVTGDSFGCADSVRISLVLNTPVDVSLGNDISIGINAGTTLNAGTGFETYEWFFGTENLNWEYPTIYIDGETYGLGTWEFSVKVGNGVCYDNDTILVTFTNYNFIDESQNVNISVYPNPAINIVHINSPDAVIKNISVFTIDGKEILKESNNNYFELNVSHLSAGTYFIKITNFDGNTIIKKFLKN